MRSGSPGGMTQIKVLCHEQIAVAICGETIEWQMCKNVRDALAHGSSWCQQL